MRRFAAGVVVGMVALASSGAHADWRTDLYLVERPNDVVDVFSPGDFSVGYSAAGESGAYLFLGGALSRTLSVGVSSFETAGTFYNVSDDCFVSVKRDGVGTRSLLGTGTGTCTRFAVNNTSVTDASVDVQRVRHAPGGGAAALMRGADSTFFLSDTNIYDFTTLSTIYTPPISLNGDSLGVVRVAGKVYALAGATADDSPVYWIASGLVERQSQTVLMGPVNASDAFSAGSPAAPYAVVGTRMGFLQGTLRSSGTALRPVQVLSDWSVESVSMNVGLGTAGNGFGMAIVSARDGSGGVAVMSPVPMLSDTEAGTVWRFRPLPPEMALAPLKKVACTGASYCVFTADRAGVGNLFIYTNKAGPKLSVSGPSDAVVDPVAGSVELVEGKPFTLTVSASDPDDDPVLVTATPISVSSAAWSVAVPATAAVPGDPLGVTGTTGNICQTQVHAGSFHVHASDGLGTQDADQDIQVYVKHTLPPSVPAVERPDGSVVSSGTVGELSAGGSPLTLKVPADRSSAGCVLTEKQWELLGSGPGAPSLTQDAGTAVLTPPRVFCEAGGGDFGLRLRVKDEGDLFNSEVFNVHVAPWGPPNAVFSPETGVEHLTAGQSLALVPNNPVAHDCEGSASFPGVVTEWKVTRPDGGVPASGLTFREEAGGRLVVDAPHCLDTTQLVVTGTHHLGAREGLAGPSSERQVMIQTDREPFDAGVLELDAGALASDELRVSVDSTLNCEAERGLRADLQLESVDGGGVPLTTTVALPGEWRVPLGVGCEGGHFQVKASMVEASGQRGAETTRDVVLPRLAAGLESLPAESVLVARCGEGARATLTQTFPAGACPSSAVAWSQVEGPPLEQTALSGDTVSLTTRDTGLDALVGRSVVVRVTAKAGPDNEASIEHTLPITVEPFVKVRRRTEVPAASETGLVGVSVELLNTTPCGVTGVSYVERLEGLTYVEGSAKFDGQPVEASWVEGSLTVKGLVLAGDGSGKLTYVARPHLVGERRMEGEARLRDVPISLRDAPGPQVPDSGCGCTSSGPGPLVFALGALVAAVRRRRRS